MPSISFPRPEYPRPDFVRSRWLNLNGEWEFEFDSQDVGMQHNWQDGRTLDRRIIVPFAYQTELSGINDKGIHEVVWYARSFEIPDTWSGENILLHFGSVDYRSSVWINGQEVGHNQGGNVPFSFEVSAYLKPGVNRVTVRVEDRQDPQQPRGKQSSSGIPRDIDYYCTTGIWQTVWLEPVSKMYIDSIRVTPLVEENAFIIIAYLHAPSAKWKLNVKAYEGEHVVCSIDVETFSPTVRVKVPINNPRLWTPDNPYLYSLELNLYEINSEIALDSLQSYAGMRSIAIKDGSVLLNNEPIFLAMALDQGYWPKGGLTAPTDDDLRRDVELTKQLGFNGSRKHQKVEDPRWLYWCDKLGLLVWGEMANARAWSPRAEEWLIGEWERVVRRDYSHPCVIAWVPMNESWGVPGIRENHPGQFAYLEKIVTLTRRLDSTRPVIDNDGWEHTDITDICAIHDYTATSGELQERYREALTGGSLPTHMWLNNIPLFARGSTYHGQPVILTEVGGFLMISDEAAQKSEHDIYHFYGLCRTPEEMLSKYEDLIKGIKKLPFIAGFCYTQLVDVEHEINGLLTYDRIPKIDPSTIAQLNTDLISNRHTVQKTQSKRLDKKPKTN